MINTNLLTRKERIKWFKFLLCVGTKMEMSTRCLLRDFKELHLSAALDEKKDYREQIAQSYHVSVDYHFVPKDILSFHHSLSPKVTFGYSNVLHEECTFALTPQRRAFLEEHLEINEVYDFFGGFLLAKKHLGIYYEDIKIWFGDKLVLDCLTHEYMMETELDEELRKRFLFYNGKSEASFTMIEKLINVRQKYLNEEDY